MSTLQMEMLRTRSRRHLGSLVSNQLDCMRAVSTIRGREGRLPSGFPVGRKWQERGQTQLPLLVHGSECPGSLLQSRPCGVFPPPQQVSLIPHPTPTPGAGVGVGASDLDPCSGGRGQRLLITMSGDEPWARSQTGLLGSGAGQRVSWDGTLWW